VASGTGTCFVARTAATPGPTSRAICRNIAVNALTADFRTVPPTLYAANDVGVFASNDNGANWSRFGTGLPNVIVSDLYLDAQSHILVAGSYGRGVWAAFADGAATPPSNDAFETPSTITGTDGAMYDSSTAATKQTAGGEPNHAGKTGGRSIWYSWTSPVTGTVTIDTVGSNFDTLLAVYEGSSLSNLTEIVANDDIDSTHKTSRVQFSAVAAIPIGSWLMASPPRVAA
jgi:hypothetical protein